LKIAEERIKEALETGASVLATMCPFCEDNLRRAAAGRIRVASVIDLVFG